MDGFLIFAFMVVTIFTMNAINNKIDALEKRIDRLFFLRALEELNAKKNVD